MLKTDNRSKTGQSFEVFLGVINYGLNKLLQILHLDKSSNESEAGTDKSAMLQEQ